MIIPTTDTLIDFIRYAPFMFLIGGGSGGFGRIALGAAGFAIGGMGGFPAMGAAIGLALGSLLFPPKQERKIRQVRGILGTSSVEGVPVAIIYGRVRVGGTIMWKDKVVFHQIVERTRTGGKGGGESQSQVVDEWWTISIAFAIGEGPLSLHQIYAGKKKIGSTSQTWHAGTSNQGVDGFLSAKTGKAIAYRNTAYIVFHDFNLGRSDTLPQFTFEVSSGHQGQIDLAAGSAKLNTWMTHSGIRVSESEVEIEAPQSAKFVNSGIAVSPTGDIWVCNAGAIVTGAGNECAVVSRATGDYIYWPNDSATFGEFGAGHKPWDLAACEASGFGEEQLIVFLNTGWTDQFRKLRIWRFDNWDQIADSSGKDFEFSKLAGIGDEEIFLDFFVTGDFYIMLGLFPFFGDIYFAYKTSTTATDFILGRRTLTIDTDTGDVAHEWEWKTVEEEASAVYFVKGGFGNTLLHMIISKGAVYEIRAEGGLSFSKISTNNLDDDHQFAMIGGISSLSNIIYAAYMDNDLDGARGFRGVGLGNEGRLKTFNISTGKWSKDRLYETLGIVTFEGIHPTSNWKGTYQLPIHVEGSGIYFVINYDDSPPLPWSAGFGDEQGNRLQVTVDFDTILEIDQFTHWGPFMYLPQIDKIYRSVGWNEGQDTQVEVPNAPTDYNDILYSRVPPDGDFGIITTAAAMNDIITNDRYGGGFTKEIEHLPAIQDCMDLNYYLNVAITERRDLASVLEIMAVHGWVALIYSGNIIKLLVARNTPAGATVELSDLLGKQGENTIDVSESSRSERFNRLTVEYTDPNKDFSVRPIMIEDLADQQRRGVHKNTVSLNGFVVKETTMTLGQKMLRSSLWGRKLLNFTLGPEFLAREAGDVITLNVPVVGLNLTRCRILAIDETPEFNLVVSAREEPVYIYDDVNYSVPGTLAEGAITPTAGLCNVVAFTPVEVPFELSSDTTRVEVALLWTKKETDTAGIDFHYSRDNGVSFSSLLSTFTPQSSGIIKTNNLGLDLWVDESSFEVDASIGVDSSFNSVTRAQMFAGQNLFIIEDELSFIQTATLGTTNQYTMNTSLRGRFNTLVQSHLVGITVFNIDNPTFVHFDTTDIGSTYPLKAVPINTLGESMDISEVPVTNFTIEGWAFRPYPPPSVQLKENGISLRGITTTGSRDITLTWKSIDKSVGYGRGGWGAHPYGATVVEGSNFRGVEIDVYHDGTLVNTYDIGIVTENTYTEAQNIADNPSSTFKDVVMFRLFNKSIYGRSRNFTEITINVISVV